MSEPEQIIGNVLRTGLRLQNLGIRINRRSQAFGSAAMDCLRDAGYTIVPQSDVDELRRRREVDAEIKGDQ